MGEVPPFGFGNSEVVGLASEYISRDLLSQIQRSLFDSIE